MSINSNHSHFVLRENQKQKRYRDLNIFVMFFSVEKVSRKILQDVELKSFQM